MKLTSDNYYSREADKAYYSCSQIDAFRECEAKAMALLEGRHEKEQSDAFLLGNYFHTAMEGEDAHKAFCEANFGAIYKTKETKARGFEITGKYAAFERADQMIAAALAEPKFSMFRNMDGENERILTGRLFGKYPWKIRLDRYIFEPRAIVDWKTVASMRETIWDAESGGRVSFIRAFGYIMRAAVYLEIEKQATGSESDAAFFLACVSKQDPPDKELVTFSTDFGRQEMDLALEKLEADMARISRVKEGPLRPLRCGTCEYCRATKRINSVKPISDFDPGFMPPREQDYDAA